MLPTLTSLNLAQGKLFFWSGQEAEKKREPGVNFIFLLSFVIRGLGGLVVYSSDSHGDGTGLILAAAFGYTLVTTNLYGG